MSQSFQSPGLNLCTQLTDLLQLLTTAIGCRSARITMLQDGRLEAGWSHGPFDLTPTSLWQQVLTSGQAFESSGHSHSFYGRPLRDSTGAITAVLSVHEAGARIFNAIHKERVRAFANIAECLLWSRGQQASAALHGANLMTILEALPIAVITKSVRLNFEFVVWNKKAEELFGIKAQEAIGRTDFDLFTADEAAFFRKKDLETLGGRAAVQVCEEPVTNALGDQVLRSHRIPVYDADNQPEFMIVMYEGLTGSRKQVGLSENEQHASVARMAQALESARLKGELLSNISHEIRGKLVFQPRSTDLRALISSVSHEHQSQARKKAIELHCEVDKVLPRFVSIDGLLLKQVLNHLIGNAIKFTEKGCVEVSIQWMPYGALRVSVYDTGLGIDPEVQQRLFLDFAKGDASPTKCLDGIGKGLAISKKLVELMNGKIGMMSQLGEGSEFWFEVPCAVGRAEVLDASDDPEHVQFGDHR